MKTYKTVVCDFDDTICTNRFPGTGELILAAWETLWLFRVAGWRIIISSCRSSNWDKEKFPVDYGPVTERPSFKNMKAFLLRHNVPYDELDDGSKGKPFADLYIDDKGAGAWTWGTIQEGLLRASDIAWC